VLAADPGLDAAAVDSAVKLQAESPDPEVLRPSTARRRLFRVDAISGSTDEVGPADLTVWEFGLLNETAVAVVSEDLTEQGWHRAYLAILDLSDRSHRELYRPAWQIQSPAISPTGRWAAVTEGWASDRGLVAGELKVIEMATGKTTELSSDTGDVTWVEWRDDQTLWFAGWSELGSSLGLIAVDGTVEWRHDEQATVGSSSFLGRIAPSVGEDGRFFAIRETVRQPPELVQGKAGDGSWLAISDFNSDVVDAGAGIPDVEEIAWESLDGIEIRGLLVRPPETTGPLPLIVNVHGGPTYGWKHAFDPGASLPLIGAGYAVLLPNYRGSTGRGQTYTQLNVGDPGGKEFEDITRGVAYCVEQGVAEPDRTGIMGASYGGYLTAWAVATSSVFSAAVMISGISDLLSCFHTCNNPPFYEIMLEGSPYDRAELELYLDRSPVAHVAGATTPTLILHGSDDLCTPVGQAQEFYQTLVGNGVPSELAIYPREGHGFREKDHQVDAWHRIRDWFDRHLVGSAA
jgi:dipeptidyl aminopeptidase/acylaminoacyl peptidase